MKVNGLNGMRFFFIVFFIFVSAKSIAAVAPSGCTRSGEVYENSLTGTIPIPYDAPAGTVLARYTYTSVSNIRCTSVAVVSDRMTLTRGPSDIANTVKTDATGLGVRVYNSSLGVYLTVSDQNMSIPINTTFGNTTWTIEIIKLAGPGEPVYSGIAGYRIDYVTNSKFKVPTDSSPWVIGRISGNNLVFIPQQCTINSSSLNFEMGTLNTSEFGSSIGFNPTKTATQNLGLSCVAGTNVYATLSATQHPDIADNSVFALSGQGGAGTASGVGMQLLYNGQPLKMGESLLLKSAAGTAESIPLTARYYQTKPVVMPGEANALAVINITYQ